MLYKDGFIVGADRSAINLFVNSCLLLEKFAEETKLNFKFTNTLFSMQTSLISSNAECLIKSHYGCLYNKISFNMAVVQAFCPYIIKCFVA